MTNSLIVADTSPLIAFSRINHFDLLSHLFGQVITTQEVAEECLTNMTLPGAVAIDGLIQSGKLEIRTNIDTQPCSSLFDILDLGEITAIALAAQLKSALLIDEKLGRGAAKEMGVKIIGTAGVLLLAKQKQLIRAVSPLIDDLHNTGYYLSTALKREILKLAGE